MVHSGPLATLTLLTLTVYLHNNMLSRTTRSSKRPRRSPRKPPEKGGDNSSRIESSKKKAPVVCHGCHEMVADNKKLLDHKKKSPFPQCKVDLITCEFCNAQVLNEYGLAVHQRSDNECMKIADAVDETNVIHVDDSGPLTQVAHGTGSTFHSENNDDEGFSFYDDIIVNDVKRKVTKKNTSDVNNDVFMINQDVGVSVNNHVPHPHQRYIDPLMFEQPPKRDELCVDPQVAARRMKTVQRGLLETIPSGFVAAQIFYNECDKHKKLLRIDLDRIEEEKHLTEMESVILEVFRLTQFNVKNNVGEIKMMLKQFNDHSCDCAEMIASPLRVKDQHVMAFLEIHATVVQCLVPQHQDDCDEDFVLNNNEQDQEDEDDQSQSGLSLSHGLLNHEEELGEIDINSDIDDVEDNVDNEINLNIVTHTVEQQMCSWQKNINNVRETAVFDKADVAKIDLYEILRTSGAPKYLFEKIQKWGKDNSVALQSFMPSKRNTFLKNINAKVYGKDLIHRMKPKVEDVVLQHGARIPVVYFSFRAALTSLLMNPQLMKDENLLLNPNDPFSLLVQQEESGVLGDLNTGWWYRETCQMFNLRPGKDLLLPLVLFIDGSRIDTNGKLNVEPITFTLGIFKRDVRNLPEAWRTIGFIEKLEHTISEPFLRCPSNTKRKLQDKHTIMKFILKELVELQGPQAGFEWKLAVGGKTHDVVFKLAVQVIIGDCKGNDELCGTYGSHSSKTAGFCRDCKVNFDNSDDPYHICDWISTRDFIQKTENQMNEMGFHKIDNAFSDLNFGAGERGVYGATPSEPLHAFKLGVCKYLFDGFLTFHLPPKTRKLMNKKLSPLARGDQRQSFKAVPRLNVVRNGISGCGTLTADEQYARIFAVYISLHDAVIFKSLSQDNRFRRESNSEGVKLPKNIGPMGVENAKEWFSLIEKTVMYHAWLYSDEHDLNSLLTGSDHDDSISSHDDSNGFPHTLDRCRNRSDRSFDVGDSPSLIAIRKYLNDFNRILNRREGNQNKLVKLHQQLHNVRQILKDGAITNVDGGRCESIAIYNSKHQGNLSQKRAPKLNWQIANNLCDDVCVQDARILENVLCKDNAQNSNSSQKRTNQGSSFRIYVDEHETVLETDGPVNVMLQWMGEKTNKPINKDLCEAIVRRLYFNMGVGGCLKLSSEVKGFTEVNIDGHTYRAHPKYRGETPWYDWALVQWDHETDPYPAQICMFLDLEECRLMNEEERDAFRNTVLGRRLAENNDVNIPNRTTYNYITRTKWMVVRSSLAHAEQGIRLLDEYRVTSKLWKRYYMEDVYRILPIEAIEGPAYCVPMNSTVNSQNEVSKGSQIISITDKSKWKDMFLEP